MNESTNMTLSNTDEAFYPELQIGLNKETAKAVNALHTKLEVLLVKGTRLAYEAGRLLTAVMRECTKEDYRAWFKKYVKLPETTAWRYLKLYEYFCANPEALTKLSLMEAYIECGVKLKKELPAPEDEGKIYTAGMENGEGNADEELRAIFERGTASGVPLDFYRVECYDGEMWGFRKGFGRFPIARVQITKPAALPAVEWNDMQRNLKIAFESFYAKVEEYEKAGTLPVPKDTRFASLING